MVWIKTKYVILRNRMIYWVYKDDDSAEIFLQGMTLTTDESKK